MLTIMASGRCLRKIRRSWGAGATPGMGPKCQFLGSQDSWTMKGKMWLKTIKALRKRPLQKRKRKQHPKRRVSTLTMATLPVEGGGGGDGGRVAAVVSAAVVEGRSFTRSQDSSSLFNTLTLMRVLGVCYHKLCCRMSLYCLRKEEKRGQAPQKKLW